MPACAGVFRTEYAIELKSFTLDYETSSLDDGGYILVKHNRDTPLCEVFAYYADSSLQARYYSDYAGHADRFYNEFYPNGNLRIKGERENDTTPFYTSLFRNFKQGKFTWFDSLGRPEIEEIYIDYRLNGPYKEFHPNGKIKTLGRYDAKGKTGKWTYYDTAGKRLKTKTFPKKTNKNKPVDEEEFYTVEYVDAVSKISRKEAENLLAYYFDAGKLGTYEAKYKYLYINITEECTCRLLGQYANGSLSFIENIPRHLIYPQPSMYNRRYFSTYYKIGYSIASYTHR